MRAADAANKAAAPHVHPRVEAAALAPLLGESGYFHPVVDIDRVPVSYVSLETLIADLRKMGATNILNGRPRYLGRAAIGLARKSFALEQQGERTTETFEILHFAAWTSKGG
jgi:hypothetical protein